MRRSSRPPRWRRKSRRTGIKLAALRLAGDLKSDPAEGTLDELLERIKAELSKLGPILDLEVVREPQSRERSAA